MNGSSLIRHYINIVESLSGDHGYRSWYNPITGEFIDVDYFSSHVRDVAKNPEKFGLTKEDINDTSPADRDPEIMNLMCSRGWIRIAAQDRNNVNKFMIFEGANKGQLLKCLKMFFEDQNYTMENASIKIRSLDGDAGIEYMMKGNEAVENAAMKGRLPNPTRFGANNEVTV